MIILPFNINAYETVRVAEHYGRRIQTVKTVEELAELQQALCKLNISYEKNFNYAIKSKLRKNVTEEIADVMIMLNQMIYIYGIEYSDLEGMIGDKIKRQFQRMEEE